MPGETRRSVRGILLMQIGAAWACLIVMLLVCGHAGADEPAAEGLDRYVSATVEMGCSALAFPGAAEGAKREAANDKILRKHRFDRESYANASFEHASNPKVRRLVEKGIGECGASARSANTGRFASAFSSAGVSGRVSISFSGGHLRGSVAGRYEGISFSISLRDSHTRGRRIEDRGTVRGVSYALVLDRRGSKLVGTLRLWMKGKTAAQIPLTVPAK